MNPMTLFKKEKRGELLSCLKTKIHILIFIATDAFAWAIFAINLSDTHLARGLRTSTTHAPALSSLIAFELRPKRSCFFLPFFSFFYFRIHLSGDSVNDNKGNTWMQCPKYSEYYCTQLSYS